MSVIDLKAREVASELSERYGSPYGSETPFLDFLKELFAQLLPLLITCLPMSRRDAASVASSLNSPNLRQRAGLRWQIWKNIDDPRTGNVGAGEIHQAMLKMGKGCSHDDAKAMMAELA